MMDVEEARKRFEESPFVKGIWPEDLRRRTLEEFEQQRTVNLCLLRSHAPEIRMGLSHLAGVLSETRLRAPVLWLMGLDEAHLEAAAGARAQGLADPQLDELAGAAAMADRDYRQAEAHLALAQPHAAHAGLILRWRVLALLLAGDRAGAERVAAGASAVPDPSAEAREDWRWLAEAFGVRPDASR